MQSFSNRALGIEAPTAWQILFFIFEPSALNNFCRGQNSKGPYEMALFVLDHLQLTYWHFWDKKIKLKILKKTVLKAELAFSYEIQKCPAQKVTYWVRLFFPFLEKYSIYLKKCEITRFRMSDVRHWMMIDF